MPETVVHFQIRMPPAMHERLASRSRDERVSLNALIVMLLGDAIARRNPATHEEAPGQDEHQGLSRDRRGTS